MISLQYCPLIWINYHASAILIIGLPLVLLFWAMLKQEAPLVRLFEIYWKTSSLLPCIMLFPPNQYHIIYIGSCIAHLLIVLSIWFWIDLNEELANLPSYGGLTFMIRSWRWAISFFCIVSESLSATTLDCLTSSNQSPSCEPWLEVPRNLYRFNFEIFSFIFGGYWNYSMPFLVASLCLAVYSTYFLHWLIFILPNRGRIAGEF
uniref:Uncharacterized protein n=1 Tax=Paulinella longichromatophora TaxID=1708747 RepID=A0A2H4ZPQ1_9EUKA|nr:hypothetical protein PLO_524 [Paulinella longichromatophora]